jgi:hypothetical protein
MVAAGARRSRGAGDPAGDRRADLAASGQRAGGERRHRRDQQQRDQGDERRMLDAGGAALGAWRQGGWSLHAGDARTALRAASAQSVTRACFYALAMEGSPFNLFGDPDEFRARMEEFAEQMQSSQRVAWADNAIKLAVDMTVAAINRLELSGSSDQQAIQVRDAIRIVFPEAVTLVREAREGLA